MSIGRPAGVDRDLDAEKRGRKPASGDSGNKVNMGHLSGSLDLQYRVPRHLGQRGQALGSV